MATIKNAGKRGGISWELNDEEKRARDYVLASTYDAKEEQERADLTAHQYQSILDRLNSDSYQNRQQRVQLQKDLYTYQKNLDSLGLYHDVSALQQQIGTLQQAADQKSSLYRSFDDEKGYIEGYIYPIKYAGKNRGEVNTALVQLKNTPGAESEYDWLNKHRYDYWSGEELSRELKSLQRQYQQITEGKYYNGRGNDMQAMERQLETLRNAKASNAYRDEYAKWDEQTKTDFDNYGAWLEQVSNGSGKYASRYYQKRGDQYFNAETGERVSGDEADYAQAQVGLNRFWESLGSLGYTSEQKAAMIDAASKSYHAQKRFDDAKRWQELSDSGFLGKVEASAASVGMNLFSGLGMLDVYGQQMLRGADPFTGEKSTVDYNSDAARISSSATAARAAVSSDMNRVGSFFYNTGMSMLDSLAARGVGAALGNVSAVQDLIFFGSAGTSAMDAAKTRGATDHEAMSVGLLAGTAESLFEHLSLDKLKAFQASATSAKQTVSQFVKNISKQAFVEGSEEVATTIANTISDAIIMADKSEINTAIQDYTDQGLTEEEATRQAWKDWLGGLAQDFAGGVISGSVMSTGAYAIGRGQAASSERAIGKQIAANEYADILRQNALQMGEGTEPHQIANNGELTNRRVGQLYNAVQQQKLVSAVENRLNALGLNENVSETARAVVKQLRGQETTKAENALLDGKQARRTMTEYQDMGRAPSSNDWAYNAVESAENLRRAAVMPKNQKAQVEREPVKTATMENGETAKVTGIKMDGENVQLLLATKNGTETVSPESVQISGQTQELIDRAKKYGDGAATMYAAYQEGQPVDAYDRAWNLAYNLYGKSGAKYAALQQSTATETLSDGQLKLAYDAGRSAAAAETQANAAKTTKKSGKGTVSFAGGTVNGVTYAAVNREGLTEEQNAAIAAVEKLAEVTGVNFVFYESAAEQAVENGTARYKYSGANGIYTTNTVYLDVNAGKSYIGDSGAILRTAAHELTHYIQEFSPEKYAELKSFIADHLMDAGVSLEALARKKMRNSSMDLRYDQAMDEVVADACEMMLRDSTAAETLARENRSLFDTIREWVVDFAAKIKKAFDGVKAVHTEALAMLRYADELQKIWDDALVDAAHRNSRAKENAAQKRDGNVQHSIDRNFASEIDAWDGKTDKTFRIGTTSDELKSIGVKDRNIIWHSKKISKILKDHRGMTKAIIKQVPEILEHPVIVLQSKSSGSRLAIFGEVQDANGAPVTAILELQPTNKGGELLDMNVIASAYGKDSSPANFIQSSGLVYLDPNKNRTKSWLQGLGLQLPSDTVAFGSVGSVSYQDGKVKIESVPYRQYMQGAAKSNTKIQNSDRDYSYEALTAKPDMKVTLVDGTAPKNRTDIVAQAKKNAAKIGQFDPNTGSVRVRVNDIDADIVLATNGLKHSLDRRLGVNAPIVVNAGDIIHNSIRINEMTAQKNEAESSYVLIGAARNKNGDLYIVRSVVNRFSNELTSMDVLYAINAKKELDALNAPRLGAAPLSETNSFISIRELLDYVNQYFPDILPESVLRHYGHTYRPGGKLGESALYQERDDTRSDREILTEALESTAQNANERAMLKEYRENLAAYNAMDAELQAMRSELAQMRKDKAPRDEIVRLKNRVDIKAAQVSRADQRLLGLQATKPLRNVVKQARAEERKTYIDRREKKIRELKQHNREVQARKRERSDQTQMWHKILKLKGDFEQMLNRPTQKNSGHAPVALAQALRDLSGAFDIENRKRTIMGLPGQLAGIKQNYENVIRTDGVLGMFYDQNVDDMLNRVIADVGSEDVDSMNASQLKEIYDLLRAFKHSITTANKFISGSINRSIQDAGREWASEIDDASPIIKGWAGDFLNWQLRPDSFLRRISGFAKNSVGEGVQNMFVDGTEKMLRIQRDFYEHFKQFSENKAFKSLTKYGDKHLIDIGLKDEDGKSVLVTRDMMLAIYKHLSSEDNLTAAAYGGFDIPALAPYYTGNVAKAFDTSVRTGSIDAQVFELAREADQAARIAKNREASDTDRRAAQEELERIESEIQVIEGSAVHGMLSIREQIENAMTDFEKQLVGASTEWMEKSAGYINTETERMYGYQKAQVQNYWPIHRNLNFVNTDLRSVTNEINLENWGSLKERVKSHAPVKLTGFIFELDNHTKQMSQFCGYAAVQRDFNRLYNTKLPLQRSSLSEKVQRKFGSGKRKVGASGQQYIDAYIASVSGTDSPDPTVFSLIRRNLPRATLTLNLRVAVSQLASIPTAAGEIGWGSVAKGFPRGLKTAFSTKEKNALAEKDVWFWQRYRGEGGMREFADMKEERNWLDRKYNQLAGTKVGRFLFNWCQDFDVAATSMMYAMSEEYVKSNTDLKPGTPEFQQMVSNKYRDVIRKTQPNYTTTERSGLLRDKREGYKFLTMYKTQSNQNLNILYDANATLIRYIRDFKAGKNGVTQADVKQAKTQFARAYTSVLLGGTLTFAVLRAAANAILHNLDAYRDDDDELTLQSILNGILQEAMGAFTGMFAFGSEIEEFVSAALTGGKYWGLSDSAISAVSELAEQTVKVIQTALDKEKDLEKDDIHHLVKRWASIAGIPIDNAKKIGEGLWNHIQDAQSGRFFSFEAGVNRSAKQQYHRLYQAFLDGDTQKAKTVFAELVASKTKDDQKVDPEKSVQSGFKSQIEKWFTGEDEGYPLTTNQAKALLTEYCGMREREAESAISEWQCVIDTGIQFRELSDAYISGEITQKDAERYYSKYGGHSERTAENEVLKWKCEKDTGISFSDLEGAYVNGKITQNQAESYRVKYGGASPDAAAETVLKWKCEKDTGIKYSEAKELFLSGELSETKYRDILLRYGGKEEADADDLITVTKFIDANPEAEGITSSRILKYIASVQHTGIGIAQYAEIMDGLDLNGNGSVSQDEARKVLDASGLSAAQKSAIWKTINKSWKTNPYG